MKQKNIFLQPFQGIPETDFKYILVNCDNVEKFYFSRNSYKKHFIWKVPKVIFLYNKVAKHYFLEEKKFKTNLNHNKLCG